MVDGKMNEMPKRDRKTLKLLSGTHFNGWLLTLLRKNFLKQVAALILLKMESTQSIEFFSRDSSRVGASLSFDGSVSGDKWNHSGKSSKGEPLNEIWTKEKY